MEEKLLHALDFVSWYGKVWKLAATYDISLEHSYEKLVVKDIITRAYKERRLVKRIVW